MKPLISNFNTSSKKDFQDMHAAILANERNLRSGIVVNDNPLLLNKTPLRDSPHPERKIESESDLIKQLLSSLSINSYLKQEIEQQPFFDACAKGDNDRIRTILNEKPHAICWQQQLDGKTGLHLAAGNGYIGVAELLLECKADIDAHNKNHHTPLMSAILLKQPLMVDYLIRKGANLGRTTQEGLNALQLAQKFSTSEIAANVETACATRIEMDIQYLSSGTQQALPSSARLKLKRPAP